MKRVWIISTTVVIAAITACAWMGIQLAGTCTVYRYNLESIVFIPNCSTAYHVARMYYQSIEDNDLEQAFRYVALEQSPGIQSNMPYKDAEQIWVGRMRRLKERGFYISRVHSIKVFTDDGYPMGSASVTVIENGMAKRISQRIHFSREDGWKVVEIDSEGGYDELDNALSGYLSQ